MRAYSTNSIGTDYGNEQQFKTSIPTQIPTVITTNITNITENFSISGGNVTNDGGSVISIRGVVWSTSQNPTLANNLGSTNNGSGTGSFDSNITGLSAGTVYYVKAYATNSAGTGYGQQESFTTTSGSGTGTVTDIDGNVYQTVIIGNQEWMAENLRVTRDDNGNNITRYCYANNTTNCDLYGGLYTWYAVMNGAGSSNINPSNVQGICPAGWHLPSDDEWTELFNYVIAQGFPDENIINGTGNALKSCRQISSPLAGECNTQAHPRWNSHSTHYSADVFGFSALPAGSLNSNCGYNFIGESSFFWSASEESISKAERKGLLYSLGIVIPFIGEKTIGFSIRCIKD